MIPTGSYLIVAVVNKRNWRLNLDPFRSEVEGDTQEGEMVGIWNSRVVKAPEVMHLGTFPLQVGT